MPVSNEFCLLAQLLEKSKERDLDPSIIHRSAEEIFELPEFQNINKKVLGNAPPVSLAISWLSLSLPSL